MDIAFYRSDFDRRVIKKWKKSKPKGKITVYDNIGNSKKIEVPIIIKVNYAGAGGYKECTDAAEIELNEYFEQYNNWVLEEDEDN